MTTQTEATALLREAMGLLHIHRQENWEKSAILAKRIDAHLSRAESKEQPEGTHEWAKARINDFVREIEIICDSFGYDPFEFLADNEVSKEQPNAAGIVLPPVYSGSPTKV